MAARRGASSLLRVLPRKRDLFLPSRTPGLTRAVRADNTVVTSRGLGQRLYSSYPAYFQSRSSKAFSLFRRILGFSTLAGVSFALGLLYNLDVARALHSARFVMLIEEGKTEPFSPPNDVAREIEEHIQNHPIARSLREDPLFTESRPHLRVPEEIRSHNLTAGTLSGTDKIPVPPFVWNEKGGKSLTSVFYLGSNLVGHPGIVHGGMLATVLDEGLAWCCFPALPKKIAVTANLNVNYRKPAPAGSFFVLRATTTKVKGRKAWVTGRIETLPDKEGAEPVVVAEADALYIEPRNLMNVPKPEPKNVGGLDSQQKS